MSISYVSNTFLHTEYIPYHLIAKTPCNEVLLLFLHFTGEEMEI